MTNAEVYALMRGNYERQFPRSCPVCARQFASLREYLLATSPVGRMVSYDIDANDWAPAEPLGTVALSNCSCGNTLGLGTELLAHPDRLALLAWLRDEAGRRGLPPQDVLDECRRILRARVLEGEP
ncbi:MAG: hypothetical protein R2712_18115 [Vicinamibacterales bacterium]